MGDHAIFNCTSDETECAETLLMLASVVCNPKINFDNKTEIYNPILEKPKNCYSDGELNNDFKCQNNSLIIEQNNNALEINSYIFEEMIRRIRLDHCYASTHTITRKELPSVPTSTRNLLEDLHEYSSSPTANIGDFNSSVTAEYQTYSETEHDSCAAYDDNNTQCGDEDSTDSDFDETNNSTVKNIIKQDMENSPMLLLKCLKSDVNEFSKHKLAYKKVRKAVESPFSNRCRRCPKSFSKKRYLTKHVQRMHSNGSTTKICFNDFSAKFSQYCQQLSSHENKYNYVHEDNIDFDESRSKQGLCECQICHIKLRRNLLIKHLASKHCVESSLTSSDTSNLITKIVPPNNNHHAETESISIFKESVATICENYANEVSGSSSPAENIKLAGTCEMTVQQTGLDVTNTNMLTNNLEGNQYVKESIDFELKNENNGSRNFLELIYNQQSTQYSTESSGHNFECSEDSFSFSNDEFYEVSNDVSNMGLSSFPLGTNMGEVIHA